MGGSPPVNTNNVSNNQGFDFLGMGPSNPKPQQVKQQTNLMGEDFLGGMSVQPQNEMNKQQHNPNSFKAYSNDQM